MNALRGASENGAVFGGGIANGDDRVEVLTVEFGNGFRTMMGNINADFPHGFDGQRIDAHGFCTRAANLIGIANEMAKKALGHLAASGIAGAED